MRDKFQPGHRCAKIVPLNVVEELWELLQLQSSSDDDQDAESSEEDTMMKISYCASEGTTTKKTIRLQASVEGKQVLILIESGNSCSFISQQAVDKLKLKTTDAPAV